MRATANHRQNTGSLLNKSSNLKTCVATGIIIGCLSTTQGFVQGAKSQ